MGTPESWVKDERTSVEKAQEKALAHLLEGLRTSIPAAAVLFSFLLVLPFNSAFADLDLLEKAVYYLAFTSAALSTILLIAPSVQQRMHWLRRQNFGHRTLDLGVALWMAVLGTTFLGVALVAVVFLVTNVVIGETAAVVALAIALALAIATWFVLPMAVELRRTTSHRGDSPE